MTRLPDVIRFPIRLVTGLTLLLGFLSGCPRPEEADLGPQPQSTGQHLIRLAHITDPQIVDEESPARLVRFTDFTRGAWRPQEAFGVHTLDALLQEINEIHGRGILEERGVDGVVVTGDLADLAQYNELQWFIDTMDGALVTPDSGLLDGLLRNVSPSVNPKLPYDAVGLDPAIPWYTCFGNHDGLAVGAFPIDRSPARQADWSAPLIPLVAGLAGLHNVGFWSDALYSTVGWSPAIIAGVGPSTLPGSSRLDLGPLRAGSIFPDPDRRFLSKEDFIDLHLASPSLPKGHGFTEASRVAGETYYTARPLADVPVRLIAIDTVVDDDSFGAPGHLGVVTREHFDSFVVPALDAALRAGEWVIVLSHHPSGDFNQGAGADRVRTQEFRDALASYDNIIMHLNGHTHYHRAELVSGAHPYLEVGTSAVIDYPQEGRILDIFLEDSGDIRVESQVFGHVDTPTTFSAESHRLARIDAVNRGQLADDGAAKAVSVGLGEGRDFTVRLKR